MQGVDAEIRSLFSKSSQNYIITSRVLQGQEDLASSTAEEQKDILMRWSAKRKELTPFYKAKSGEREGEVQESRQAEGPSAPRSGEPDPEPKTGWKYTKGLSLDERKQLHAQKEAWNKRQAARQAGGGPAPPNEDSDGLANLEPEDLENAIRESVKRTSRGNKDEDERVEKQIRASMVEMRKIAQQNRDFRQPPPPAATSGGRAEGNVSQPPSQGSAGPSHATADVDDGDDLTNVADDEYAALIQRAVQESLRHGTSGPRRHDQDDEGDDDEDDEALQVALAASRSLDDMGAAEQSSHHDEDLRRALQESERVHREQQPDQAAAMTDEEVLLEHAKQQSLAEENLRRQKAKGKAVAVAGTGDEDEDDEDDDLKRALEESLKLSGGAGSPRV
jgi:hypothetical protein